ncbi:phosphotransferase [Streptomyces sp. NPDC003691]
MKHPPDDIGEPALRRALRAWHAEAATLTYVPLGFGDHHWRAEGTGGERWFVTVSDLARKYHCGIGVDAARDGLRRAMDTAAALGGSGLGSGSGGFVVAPLRTPDGETLRDLGERYAVAVFPWTGGTAGEFGGEPDPGERAATLEALAALHRAEPPAAVRPLPPALSARDRLVRNLGAAGEPWRGGPRSEDARELLAEHASAVRRRLDDFDRLAAGLRDRAAAPVVTHGEPHPGNLLRHGGRLLLVDWDTVGLAVPERDLWLVARDETGLAHWAELTGRRPDPGALALYRLRWGLEDLDDFLDRFRSPHTATADTEEAWRGLTDTLKDLASPPF